MALGALRGGAILRRVHLYVEGGGDGKVTKTRLREGFDAFLKSPKATARRNGISFLVSACGSRSDTYSEFCNSQRGSAEETPILLVDSEGPVSAPTRKQHLVDRDGWDLSDADEGQVHLMVQMMEAWFVADREALATYYGQRFNANAIPNRADVEAIPKPELERALREATRHTQKGEYHKTRHAPELLAGVGPSKVRAAAPHCARLFAALDGLLAEAT